MSHRQGIRVICLDIHRHRKVVEQGYKLYNREGSTPNKFQPLRCTSFRTLIHGCSVGSEIALGENNLIGHEILLLSSCLGNTRG